MATTTDIHYDTGFIGRFRETLSRKRAQRAEYRRLRAELMGMSKRDLDDIGISHGQIEDIAREGAGY